VSDAIGSQHVRFTASNSSDPWLQPFIIHHGHPLRKINVISDGLETMGLTVSRGRISADDLE
jgi:hypothetical protein